MVSAISRHILLSGSNQCCGKLGANLTNLLFVVVDEGTKILCIYDPSY